MIFFIALIIGLIYFSYRAIFIETRSSLENNIKKQDNWFLWGLAIYLSTVI